MVTNLKGKNNGLTVAVPVHSGRRAVASLIRVDTGERVARPGLRHQRAVRGALPVAQRAALLPGDQVQVTCGLNDIGAIMKKRFDTEREMAKLVNLTLIKL